MCTVTQSMDEPIAEYCDVPELFVGPPSPLKKWCPVQKAWTRPGKPVKYVWDVTLNAWRFATRAERLASKRVKTNPREQYFALWARKKSDDLRWGLLSDLGMSCVARRHPCETAELIPEVDWSDKLSDSLMLVQARALFSKDEDMLSSIDKEKVAYESFLLSEKSCKAVNDSIRDGSFYKNNDTAAIMHYAAEKISLILGPCPEIADLGLKFGPGASTSCGKRTSARWKLSSKPSITHSGISHVLSYRETLPHWFALHGYNCAVETGRLEFVPKNFRTDRSINIEPTVSGMVQKGYGSYIRRKLRKAGIDLSDQTINRMRAFFGSISGLIATLDLERASDSIAYLLIMELLAIDWFASLDAVRTSVVQYHGQNIKLEKFSSMGNGYTFELESLVFYALCWGIAQHFDIPFDLTVYGDDLVSSTSLAQKVTEIFPTFGLTINAKKSFLSGPFRESCGGDYLLGLDVRPFFIKDRFTYHRVACFYNFLVRKPWFDRDKKMRSRLLQNIPEEYQLWGPDGFGDGHLICDRPQFEPCKRDKGYSGYTFKTFVESPNKDKSDAIGDAVLPTYVALSSQPLISERGDKSFARKLFKKVDDKSAFRKLSERAPDHYSVRSSGGMPGVSVVNDVYVLNPAEHCGELPE